MSEEMIVDPHPDDVLSMAIRQRDAARAERDDYAARLKVVDQDWAKLLAAHQKLTGGIRELIRRLDESAAATRPSRKSSIEDECAIALRQLLEL